MVRLLLLVTMGTVKPTINNVPSLLWTLRKQGPVSGMSLESTSPRKTQEAVTLDRTTAGGFSIPWSSLVSCQHLPLGRLTLKVVAKSVWTTQLTGLQSG